MSDRLVHALAVCVLFGTANACTIKTTVGFGADASSMDTGLMDSGPNPDTRDEMSPTTDVITNDVATADTHLNDAPPDSACPTGNVLCAAVCTDLFSDSNNCGACGQACALRSNCVRGVCAPGCAAGTADCDSDAANGCEANLQSDANNCGACGVLCPAGQNCMNGACAPVCSSGTANCDGSSANGCETNLQTDFANCGSCGFSCPAGQSCTAGRCVTAGCSTPQIACGGACVDPTSDPANCGACGALCSRGLGCVRGACM